MKHARNEVYLHASQIKNIIDEMASQIENCYKDCDEVTTVIVLEGARKFSEDILKKLSDKFISTYITAKSYEKDKSTGKVNVDMSSITSIVDKDVLLLDDIYHTGKTISVVKRYLTMLKPKRIQTCVLFDRINFHKEELIIDFIGHTVYHSDFLVGYGLDYCGKYRKWPYVVRVKEDRHARELKKLSEIK